jgi:hypothetical protein
MGRALFVLEQNSEPVAAVWPRTGRTASLSEQVHHFFLSQRQ